MESMDTRVDVNPIRSPQAGYARASQSPERISLDGPQALLVHQLFNELLNGIRGIQFEIQIGMSEAALRVIFDEFNTWVEAQAYDEAGVIVLRDSSGASLSSFERIYSSAEIKSIRNMAEVVMLDLGQEEFQTRTGFNLTEAKLLLDRFNAALLDPLHLDAQSSSVPH
jgi:hypothetical protein